MKILIFYNPRSKSTITHEILAKKFNVHPWGEILTRSRRKNQHYLEYAELIRRINETDDICIKTGPTDFIDLKNQEIKRDYQQIDWSTFDHLVFVRRNNIFETILSYGYQDQHNPENWHRRRGSTVNPQTYTIDPNRMYYILRSYRLYADIEKYICAQVKHGKIYHYEFETLEDQLKTDFGLTESELITSTQANEIDYKKFAINYADLLNEYQSVHKKFLSATAEEIANKNSFFWHNKVDYI
jgi:hypothetical protein